MNSVLIITLLFLIPALIVANEDFSWEQLALSTVRKSPDSTSVRGKLNEIGAANEVDYENFRLRQIFFSGALTIPLIYFLLIKGSSMTVAAGMLIAIPAATFIYFEKSLNNKVLAHRDQIDSDFPGIVEMMTLALSAGESPLTVLNRISSRGRGPLTREFTLVIEHVKAGVPFAQALDAMSRKVHSVAVRRFVDALVIATTRGAPLIEVLQSHAREARDFQRNRILSAAGKSELAMMIPVVFLILPISILFALWPSLSNLNLFAYS